MLVIKENGDCRRTKIRREEEGLRGVTAWFRLFGVRNLDVFIFGLHSDIKQAFSRCSSCPEIIVEPSTPSSLVRLSGRKFRDLLLGYREMECCCNPMRYFIEL